MGAATISPGLPKGRRRHPDLIFEWVGRKGQGWRLVLFLNLSLALHVACFYAFQVVYPTPVRQRAETTKVTFLDPRSDAGVRDVINRIEGRTVFFDGSLRLAVPGTALEGDEANEVIPVPAFATHRPTLQAPPEIPRPLELPRIFAPGEVFLPQRSRHLPEAKSVPRPEPYVGPFVYRPSVSALGGIAEAEITRRPDWDGSQELLASAEGNRIRFLVEVNGRGRISSCLPWIGIENVFDAAMARKIETELRFAPSGFVRHGWLEVRW
ncbi:MAG: hypothetical protein ACR2RV_18880 [Verrucomicrobiales bacterium]